MITRQKKKAEAEKSMGKNKVINNRSVYLAEFGILILGVCGMWLTGSIKQTAPDRLLANCVMTVLGLSLAMFHRLN